MNLNKIFQACRFKRTLWPLTLMLIPVAWVGGINPEVILLASVLILFYGAVALHNAWVDGDHGLGFNEFIFGSSILLLVSAMICVIRPVFFGVYTLYGLLGYLYNTISRKILFADNLILMFSHVFVPVFLTGFLMNMETWSLFILAAFSALTFYYLSNLRNFKDIISDSRRGYKTIVTSLSINKAYSLMKGSIILCLIIAFLPYHLLELGFLFIPLFGIFASLVWLAYEDLKKKNFKKALSIARFSLFIYSGCLILSKSIDLLSSGILFSLMAAYGSRDFIMKDYG